MSSSVCVSATEEVQYAVKRFSRYRIQPRSGVCGPVSNQSVAIAAGRGEKDVAETKNAVHKAPLAHRARCRVVVVILAHVDACSPRPCLREVCGPSVHEMPFRSISTVIGTWAV